MRNAHTKRWENHSENVNFLSHKHQRSPCVDSRAQVQCLAQFLSHLEHQASFLLYVIVIQLIRGMGFDVKMLAVTKNTCKVREKCQL